MRPRPIDTLSAQIFETQSRHPGAGRHLILLEVDVFSMLSGEGTQGVSQARVRYGPRALRLHDARSAVL